MARHDAIGETVLEMQKSIVNFGYNSEIFVEKQIDPTKSITKPFTEYTPQKNDLIIYHHSIGSELAKFLSRIDQPKLLFYHNITPSKFFVEYDQTLVSELEQGRDQLKILSNSFEYAMAASGYNKNELTSYGFKTILDMQYFLNLERFNKINLDQQILDSYNDTTNIIFVGRRSPNKKVEDILKIFAYYKIFNPKSKLFLLGGSWSVEKYVKKLEKLKKKLKINNEDVVSIETLSDKELKSYFEISDVFVCMSEHEGFCIPLVESMHFHVPIIAFNAGAVPDTLGGSGILVNHKKFGEIAQIIDILMSDDLLKEQIIKQQNERLMNFNNEKATILLKNNIELVLKSIS
ncbi:Glycosyltransferase [Nitrosopumilus piranensis]|uniref:Glycosyltransferase n=1 Tax=Nitrosopumilus piranensis TaxID=1582439 RepID=A0A0C5BWA0_9ARCH|nr:Glycosyltransferase [Nitrosopumilus piranensis]